MTNTERPQIEDATLYRLLDQAGISYDCLHHKAVFTVEESQKVEHLLPKGQAIKNLFLKDRKNNFWLLSVCDDLRLDLKTLSKVLGAKGSLSFANSDYLWDYLKVLPGSVNPYAILNSPQNVVAFYMDEKLYQSELFHAHPMRNDRTITTETRKIVAWLDKQGYAVGRIDFTSTIPKILS